MIILWNKELVEDKTPPPEEIVDLACHKLRQRLPPVKGS